LPGEGQGKFFFDLLEKYIIIHLISFQPFHKISRSSEWSLTVGLKG